MLPACCRFPCGPTPTLIVTAMSTPPAAPGVLVVVPTLDEADNVVALLERVRAALPEAAVLVVDDGSTDGTPDLVRATADRLGNVRLECRDGTTGLGDAYRHGFRLGVDEGYSIIVQLDADLSHDPAELPLMVEVANRGVDVVIGSRYIPGGRIVGWPRRRVWLSRWGNRYSAIALGLAVNDATAGYRVYRADALRRIDLDHVRADGYGFQIEMTYRAVERGMRIVEVPITFVDRQAGESKMNRSIILEAFWLVTRWSIVDALSLRRRRRAYGESD